MSGRFAYIALATFFAIVPCVLAGTFEPPLPSGSPPHRKEWVWIQVADVEHYMLPILYFGQIPNARPRGADCTATEELSSHRDTNGGSSNSPRLLYIVDASVCTVLGSDYRTARRTNAALCASPIIGLRLLRRFEGERRNTLDAENVGSNRLLCPVSWM